jgi:hypothetical protein
MNLVDELHAIARTLGESGIPYAVCGGVAVTIHGATRTTKDIDLLVPSDRVEAIVEAVRPLGYIYVALPMTFERGTPRERRVQRVTKVEGEEHLVLDLIFEEAAFHGLLRDRVEILLPEGPLVVVSLATLGAMKRIAHRPQDIADLQKLGLATHTDEEDG